MSQSYLDLQKQVEPTSSDFNTTQPLPLFIDSPVLLLEPIDQASAHLSEQIEQTEQTTSSKVYPPLHNTNEIPPPKNRYDIMKVPPIFPPTLTSKPSLSTNRDDHLIPLLSQDNFTFKTQLTSLYMHFTDHTFRLNDKKQEFFTSLASKKWSSYQYGLDNGVEIFSLQYKFLRPSIYDLKNLILPSSQLHKKLLIIKHILNFYNTPNYRTTIS